MADLYFVVVPAPEDRFDIRIFLRKGDNVYCAEPVRMRLVENNNAPPPPTLTATKSELVFIASALDAHCDDVPTTLPPPAPTDAPGELQAVKRHLDDLRAILFDPAYVRIAK